MSRSDRAVHVFYVDPDGLVRSGRLVTEPQLAALSRAAESGYRVEET